MTPELDPLESWSKYHALLFGLDTPRDVEMLMAWVDVFRAAGVTATELREVSDWLAVHDAPRFRSDHLAAIQTQVKALRAPPPPEPPPEPDPRGTCTLCDGTGRVIVPEPRYLAMGKWGTCAVLCSCVLGNWYAGRPPKGKPPQMTLAAYAALYPDWQATMRAHAESIRQPAHEAALRRQLTCLTPGLSRLGPLTDAVDAALGRVSRRPGNSGRATAGPYDERR